MTPSEYRTALTTLGLTQQAAGRWLRVSPKTAQNYAKHGPSGPAAVAVEMRLAAMSALRSLDGAQEVLGGEGYFSWARDCIGSYNDLHAVCGIAALKGEAG